MGSVVSREELRRLEKAAREKDKKKLASWLQQFERYLDTMLRKDYEQAYQEEIASTVQNTLTAVAYTAYFSEESKVNKDDIGDYMSDLFVTLDMFRTGEYKPLDYKEALEKAGVYLEDYDYDGPYKKVLKTLDTELVKFLKSSHRKIITICGDITKPEGIYKVRQNLTLQGYITLDYGVFDGPEFNELFPEEIKQIDKMEKEKILISDAVYIVNEDTKLSTKMKSLVKYAEKHNKEIMYLNPIEE